MPSSCVVWTLDDDGLVTRVQGFLPHQEAEALEAAGLKDNHAAEGSSPSST